MLEEVPSSVRPQLIQDLNEEVTEIRIDGGRFSDPHCELSLQSRVVGRALHHLPYRVLLEAPGYVGVQTPDSPIDNSPYALIDGGVHSRRQPARQP